MTFCYNFVLGLFSYTIYETWACGRRLFYVHISSDYGIKQGVCLQIILRM